jgi:hypothetical protein
MGYSDVTGLRVVRSPQNVPTQWGRADKVVPHVVRGDVPGRNASGDGRPLALERARRRGLTPRTISRTKRRACPTTRWVIAISRR